MKFLRTRVRTFWPSMGAPVRVSVAIKPPE
jgi:hypothetical protein